MTAYVVVEENIHDQETFDAYRKDTPATVAAFGGRFIVRGGRHSVEEGEWPFQRLAILEFPSREAAEGWYRSPAYQKLLPLRLKASTGTLIIVDGV